MQIRLDEWQKKVLSTKGNIVLRSGRQVGKSTVISILAGDYAAKNKNKNVMVVAAVERQAYLLFEKILGYVYDNYQSMIKRGKDRPTKSKLSLTNGTTIYCLPTGMTGYGIRGYTIDVLIGDEAAFINEAVYQAITPSLSITKGRIILLSTPFGKQGYFYDCFSDPSFTSFHVSAEDCPRHTKEFLAQERARMTEISYAQEYLGEFVDELRQFFPTELIKSCMTTECNLPTSFHANPKFFLGVDVARMGRDESVLFSLALQGDTLYEQELIITKQTRLTDTARLIINAEQRYGYKKIYIDDGGLGVGVFDILLDDSITKRKVEAINNSSRGLDNEDKRRKKLLKEDLYNNLLTLMERGLIRLKPNDNTELSLRSIQAEYTAEGKLKIFGSYSHVTEALIRAAWGVTSKSLNIFISY